MSEPKRYWWLKLHKDIFKSKRIKKLRRLAGGDTYTIIYLKMQLLSLADDGSLFFSGLENTFEEEIALDIDENTEDVAVTIAYLLKTGLLIKEDEDSYSLPFVKGNVGSETQTAIRVRNHREKQKALHCNTDVTEVKQNCNGEKEIEKDKELELEIEKEIEKEIDKELEKDIVSRPRFESIVNAWNTLSAFGITPIRSINPNTERYKSLNARIRQYGIDAIYEAIDKIKESDFLQGKHKGRSWQITFDWFICPNNFPKVLEGNYDNSEQTTSTTGSAYIDAINNRIEVVDSWV